MTTKTRNDAVAGWSRKLMATLLAGFCLGATATACATDTHPIGIGSVTIMAEIAATPSQTARGLMFRRRLPMDQGMLFVFSYPRQLSFWMRNTIIPLDIGYFDAHGELREIYPLHPRDERPVRSQSDALVYALEVNRGWYHRNAVNLGARLNLDDLGQALSDERLQR